MAAQVLNPPHDKNNTTTKSSRLPQKVSPELARPGSSSMPEMPEDFEERNAYYNRYPNTWSKIREYIREPAAEALGTFVLVLFGLGVNCQATLSADPAVSPTPKGDYGSVTIVWGAAISLGVWVAGGISGGHINPAVTLTFATFRGFPWRKVPGYILAQLFGAWIGALVVYSNYFHAINIVEGGKGIRTVPGTAALFGSYALPYVPAANAFFDEFIGTFALVFIIFAVTDRYNGSPPAGLVPLAVFIVTAGITGAYGMQTAFAINPARDLGPRIMTAMVGYGRAVFNYRSQFWLWCQICGPIAGALTAGLVYDAFIYVGAESLLNHPNKNARKLNAEGNIARSNSLRDDETV